MSQGGAQSDEPRIMWLAEEMVRETADRKSLRCYQVIARRCPEALIFEALALLKEARTDGTNLRSRGGFFVAAVRRL